MTSEEFRRRLLILAVLRYGLTMGRRVPLLYRQPEAAKRLFRDGLERLWQGETVVVDDVQWRGSLGAESLRNSLLGVVMTEDRSRPRRARLATEMVEHRLGLVLVDEGAAVAREVRAAAAALVIRVGDRLDELDIRMAASTAELEDVERLIASQVDRLFGFFDGVDLGASGNRDRLDGLLAEFALEVEAFGAVDVAEDGLVAAWPSEFEPLAERVDRLAGLVPELDGVGEAEVARLRVVGLGRFAALLASDPSRGEFWGPYDDAVTVWLGSPDASESAPELEEFRPDDPQDHWNPERAVFDVAVAEPDRSVFDRVYLLSVAGIGDWLVSAAPTPESVDGVVVYGRRWSAVEGLVRDLVLADLAGGARPEADDVEVLGRLLSTVRGLTGDEADELVARFADAVEAARTSITEGRPADGGQAPNA